MDVHTDWSDLASPYETESRGSKDEPAGVHALYSLPKIIRSLKSRRLKWAGHVAHMEQSRNARVLVGKPKGKRPLERLKHRWEDNIKMNLG